MNKTTCSVSVGKDRRDLAIGEINRLLPLLPVKELDALGDRLRQRLQPELHQLGATGKVTIMPRPQPSAKPSNAAGPGGAPMDILLD